MGAGLWEKPWVGVFMKVKEILFLVVATKAMIFFSGFIGCIFFNAQEPSLDFFIHMFNRWDSSHYIEIARNWYPDTGENRILIVFLPLYPLLIRLLTFDFSYVNLVALIISNTAFLIGAIYLYKLVRLDYGDDDAFRSVLYFSIFPTAYFFCAIYTESLFILFVLSSFYYARNSKWMFAGILGMLASLTRIFGIVLFPALIIEYLNQKKWKVGEIKSDVMSLFIIPAGSGIYLLLNYIVFNDFLAFIRIQKENWFQSFSNPVKTIINSYGTISWATFPDVITIGYAQIVFSILGIAVIVWSVFNLRPSDSFYSFITWFIATSTSFAISIPRFVLMIFPVFIFLSIMGRKELANYLILLFCSILLTIFTIWFSMGRWAF